jgi:hypothetical protein
MSKMTKIKAKNEVMYLTCHIHMPSDPNGLVEEREIRRAKRDLAMSLHSLLECDINIENVFNIGTVILEAYNLGRLAK